MVAKRSITWLWLTLHSCSFSMDKRESWWSLPCPMVDLSQVWSLLDTLKDRSQLQLFTGIVSAMIWIICVSVGNIVGSSMLKTPCISIISFFVLRNFLSTKTSSFEYRQFFIHYSFSACVRARMVCVCVCVCLCAIKLQATDTQYWKTGANYVGNIL